MTTRRLAAWGLGTPVAALALAMTPSAPATAHDGDGTIAAGPLRYRVVASAPRLNRRVTGPVRRHVQGVPAEPVDSFVYDGDGSTPVRGRLVLELDPTSEVGSIEAEWSDRNGAWTYRQDRFLHPEHVSGVRIGSSVERLSSVLNEAVAPNVHIHGDTGAGMPVMPTLFAFLATWGPADVTLDGQRFDNPFEIPAPQWLGHVMVTEGARFPDGTVRTLSGGIYDPSRLTEGAVEDDDLEVHLVFHDERFPETENFPPIFSFFYHLVFEDVSIEIVQAERPIHDEADGPRPVRPFPGFRGPDRSR